MSADSSRFSCRIESVHSSQSDKEADLSESGRKRRSRRSREAKTSSEAEFQAKNKETI